jgi:hypothetical protein
MSANTSPKLELLLVLEQSRTWSNARDSRQHKCRPMPKLTKWITAAIPCNPYLVHGAFVNFFWPCVGRLKYGTFCLCLSCLASLCSIRENTVTKIIWFLILRHSFWCVFPHIGSIDIPFSSYPLKAKYVELMGKDKGYNSSHAYCQVKRELWNFLKWFWKGFLKWYDGVGENGLT